MLNQQFAGSAWDDRARAVVLVPELEAWVWNESLHVDEVAGWSNRLPGLRRWLTEEGWPVAELVPRRRENRVRLMRRDWEWPG